ncbi:MAG TPA: 50S ribosomal protein L11 methyltransferase [Longimicrobiales bacterium]|nr:50S ribosomal protein L11 methyltransferase [Longimicrobiales bacterium]
MIPDRWFVLSVRSPSEELNDELAEGLIALGGASVEEELDLLTSYYLPPEDPQAFARAAQEYLERLLDLRLEVVWRWEEHTDWAEAWRRGLKPRRVGRIVVTPSWAQPERLADDLVIVVDPEMAFGTGEHATTRGALRLLQEAVRPGDRVLDVGTGSGILSIAAAMLGAGPVLAVEADADAIGNARDNLRRNGVDERVTLLHAFVDRPFLERHGAGAFDLILGNILSGVLRPLLPAFREALAPDGRLVVGGILEEEADGMMEAAAAAGFELRTEDLEDEWWGALFVRAATVRPRG